MSSGLVAYDPTNTAQTSFLAALAQGETGGASNGYSMGVGGSDLSGASTDAYGFPQWSGVGNSHAAGEYQFQPGTWDQLAQTYGLNFGSASDQNEAAWYYAQSTYAAKTNGGSLTDALSSGDYSSVQSALAGVWPSVNGNGSSPGLASLLSSGGGASLSGTGSGSGSSSSGSSSGSGGVLAGIEDFFVRFGLIIVGVAVLVIALWSMLSQHTSVPSPGATVKAAGELVGA